jgi:hypothetical protein
MTDPFAIFRAINLQAFWRLQRAGVGARLWNRLAEKGLVSL